MEDKTMTIKDLINQLEEKIMVEEFKADSEVVNKDNELMIIV